MTPNVMQGYLKIFNLLWKIKRVEHMLNQSWTINAAKKHDLSKLKEISGDLHMCTLLRHEMIHFITNLSSYMQVEVLESAWKTFTDELNVAENLDEIRIIQEKFIEEILDKALLSQAR